MSVKQVQSSGDSQPVSTDADPITCPKGLPENPPSSDHSSRMQRYLTTPEASRYLRRSQSWLLRQAGIPYLPGRPNTYDIEDLDNWVESHKHQPLS